MWLQTSNLARRSVIKYLNQKYKIGSKMGVTCFEFWNFLLSLDRLKLQTSNFAGGLRVKDAQQKLINRPKGGVT